MVTIAVDAMGSDKAPAPEIEGAVQAAKQFGHRILLVGDRHVVDTALDAYDGARDLPIEVIHAAERITMEDHAAKAARTKKGSSMHLCARLVAAGKAGLKTMIGCMIETSVLISAGAHLANLADYLDLDGNLLITNDPFAGATAVNGMISFAGALDKTGLCVRAKN